SRHSLGDRDRAQACEKMLDERLPTSADGAPSAEHAVQQLADGDHADRALGVAEKRLGAAVAPPEVDQQIGIDRDGYGSATGPALSRIARRSSPNPSSGLGALA